MSESSILSSKAKVEKTIEIVGAIIMSGLALYEMYKRVKE